jgi:hypothetical protein
MSSDKKTREQRIADHQAQVKAGTASGEMFFYDEDGYPRGIDPEEGEPDKDEPGAFDELIEELGLADKFADIAAAKED